LPPTKVETAVAFGFKDRNNGTAQSEYLAECREVVELTNVAIVQAMLPDTSAPDARVLVRTIQDTGETQRGVRPEDLLFIPHGNFYRKRGLDEIVFQPFDVHGNLITEDGRPLAAAKYLEYLKKNLPDYFVIDTEFGKYEEALLAHEGSAGRPHAW